MLTAAIPPAWPNKRNLLPDQKTKFASLDMRGALKLSGHDDDLWHIVVFKLQIKIYNKFSFRWSKKIPVEKINSCGRVRWVWIARPDKKSWWTLPRWQRASEDKTWHTKTQLRMCSFFVTHVGSQPTFSRKCSLFVTYMGPQLAFLRMCSFFRDSLVVPTDLFETVLFFHDSQSAQNNLL